MTTGPNRFGAFTSRGGLMHGTRRYLGWEQCK